MTLKASPSLRQDKKSSETSVKRWSPSLSFAVGREPTLVLDPGLRVFIFLCSNLPLRSGSSSSKGPEERRSQIARITDQIDSSRVLATILDKRDITLYFILYCTTYYSLMNGVMTVFIRVWRLSELLTESLTRTRAWARRRRGAGLFLHNYFRASCA
jgi:hypothetical protein